MLASNLGTLDPEWQPYLHLYGSKEARHPTAGLCFICEGRYLVDEALKAGRAGSLNVLSVVAEPRLVPELEPCLPPGTVLLTADEAFLQELLGFPFHRGMLCCVQRPPDPDERRILEADRLLVLPRIDNVDNLGQLMRTSAALGMDAVLLGRGPGAYERRTVRVSMGAAWRVPVLQMENPAGFLNQWREAAVGEIVGAALSDDALDISLWQPRPRTALVLGPEDKGLDAEWLRLCDRLAVIPMASGMDSLNVAAAGAILMHRLLRESVSRRE